MIKNNRTNLVATFGMLLQKLEAEIEFSNEIAARALAQCPGRRR